MGEFKLTESYYRLLDIIWRSEPMTLLSLVEHAAHELGWKRTTVTTVLKKLCDEGYCEYDGKMIRALVKRERVERDDSAEIVSRRFGGSLPRFITAFVEEHELSDSEIDEILALLRERRGGGE